MKTKNEIEESLDYFKKKNNIEKMFIVNDSTNRIALKYNNNDLCWSIRTNSEYLRMENNPCELTIWKYILEKNQISDILTGSFFNPKLLLKKNTSVENLLIEKDLKEKVNNNITSKEL